MIGHGLALDFEGSKKTGIREVGLVRFKNFDIIAVDEFALCNQKNNEKFRSLLGLNYDFFISHHASVERNFLKMTMPFPSSPSITNWGPWLDTKLLYEKLYPNLKNYNLSFLTEVFLEQKHLMELTTTYCKPKKMAFHNALYDSFCSFLLAKRLSQKVCLQRFIHY